MNHQSNRQSFCAGVSHPPKPREPRDGCESRLGALLDSASEGAAQAADGGTVLVLAERAHTPKLKTLEDAQWEHGQEVGQALEPAEPAEPGSACPTS
jgi:hypothetical protein